MVGVLQNFSIRTFSAKLTCFGHLSPLFFNKPVKGFLSLFPLRLPEEFGEETAGKRLVVPWSNVPITPNITLILKHFPHNKNFSLPQFKFLPSSQSLTISTEKASFAFMRVSDCFEFIGSSIPTRLSIWRRKETRNASPILVTKVRVLITLM